MYYMKLLWFTQKLNFSNFLSKVIQRTVNKDLSVERKQKYVHKIRI